MADVKKLLGNVALPDYSRLVYHLDSEGDGIKITNKNDHRIFSVRIDSETIKLNSEGNLYLPLDGQTVFYDASEGLIKATGLTVSEGDAIRIDEVIINGVPQETINVLFDSETIVLDSEGRLTVPIDRQTIIINSEGKMVAIPEPLKDGVATHVHFGTPLFDSEAIDVLYDSETLRVDSENRLYVPIDHELIIVNSEGFITANIDKKTLIFENDVIETRIGGWREDPVDTEFFAVNEAAPAPVVVIEGLTAKPEPGDSVTVDYQLELSGLAQSGSVTFTVADDGEWLTAEDAGADNYIDGVKIKKDFTEGQLILDPARAANVTDLVATVHGETFVYHKVKGIYLPTDNRTIYVTDDAAQSLKVIYRVDEERGLEVNSEEQIAVKVDGLTIGFDSEGRLCGTKKLEAIMPIRITSEGDSEGEQKIKLEFVDPITVNSEGRLAIKVDNLTIKLNSEGELASALEAGEAIEIVTSEGKPVVNVLYDNKHIFLNSENQLELHLNEMKALEVDSEDMLAVKVDGDTVRFNSEGELEAKTILEGEANHIYESEGNLIIDVLYDDVTIHLNSENQLELHPDELKAFAVDSEGKLFVKADEVHIFYSSEGKLELHLNEEKALEVDSEGKLAVKVDDLSIKFDSEGRLFAIPEPLFDGIATKINPKTSVYDSESVDVLFDSEAGLGVNPENELFVKLAPEALEFNSEGQIKVLFDRETIILNPENELSLPLDERTIVVSEGVIKVDIDNKSLVYSADSEGIEKVRVNIDNETIRFNSEGKLSADALPKPYIEDTFLHINSETMEPEWVEAKINGVSLKGDHNTEEAKIIWWGTSEEYAALEAAGLLSDYTLYVLNDHSPIVEPDKDYEELINKPQINGVTLSGNKTLANFGIQPTLTNGVATSLSNNEVSVQYLSGVLGVDSSNRLYADTYTTEQIDNLLASLRSIKYEATKPTTGVRNTLYYVGTASPYDIYLYDSFGTEVYLGTSAVQTYSAGQGIAINASNVISADVVTVLQEDTSSNIAPTAQAVVNYAEHKTNKVTTLSSTSTNDQYPSAKLVYDKLNEKVDQVAPSDTSLQILGGTTLTHVEPSDLGGAATIGSQTVIPKITYDKFGHIQKTEEAVVYPPTTAGINGQIWQSDGLGAGQWAELAGLLRVKYQPQTATGVSDSTTIVIPAPAADTGYARLCCIGAYITSNVPGVCWSVTQISDSQVTIFANGWAGSQDISATTVWLYARTSN